MQFRVGVDLDGVVYDWDRAARDWINKTFGTKLEGASKTWHEIPETVSQVAWDALWKDGVEDGLFCDFGGRFGEYTVPGALTGLGQLCDFADVVIITGRPESASHSTLEWLALSGLTFREVHLVPKHGLKSKQAMPCHVYIDDKPSNVTDLATLTEHSYVFDQPWNQEFQWPKRLHSWHSFVQITSRLRRSLLREELVAK